MCRRPVNVADGATSGVRLRASTGRSDNRLVMILPPASGILRRPPERSHRGLVRRFAKPLSGVTCFEGSNPSLSARYVLGPMASRSSALDLGERTVPPAGGCRPSLHSAPVAQRIERQVADLKVVG